MIIGSLLVLEIKSFNMLALEVVVKHGKIKKFILVPVN
jgi:hypothetical protein